jgi:hypothetical protein
MGEALQEFISAIVVHDRLGDHRAERRHAARQPGRNPPRVKRQIGAAGALRHFFGSGSTSSSQLSGVGQDSNAKQGYAPSIGVTHGILDHWANLLIDTVEIDCRVERNRRTVHHQYVRI